MELLFGIVIGLIILAVLVVIHELGHAVMASRSGVIVEEFGVGFPPRAWSKKLKNGVLLSLNWLPLGGFVKLKGEHDAARGEGEYGKATYWQKTKILLAGVVMNWIAAAILLTVLAWTGLPKILPDQFSIASDTTVVAQPVEVASLITGSPAEKAGLKVGDQILRFNGETVPSTKKLLEQTQASKGKQVEIIYARDRREYITSVQLNGDNADNKGYLGAGPAQRERLRASWSAPLVGAVTTAQFSWLTITELKNMAVNTVQGLFLRFSSNADERDRANRNLEQVAGNVAGPIGILGIIFPAAAQTGLTELLFLTAIISLTLAVMNILPIPALDGGRWFTMTVFRLLKKPLTKEREEAIQGAGVMALLALIVIVTIADVAKIV